jgi:hypothetical protein
MDRRVDEYWERQAEYARADAAAYEELARQAMAGRSAPVMRYSGVGDANFIEMHLRALERHRDDLHQVKLDQETKMKIEGDLALADELVARGRMDDGQYLTVANTLGEAWKDNKYELNRDKRAARVSASRVAKYERMANERPVVDRYLQYSDRYANAWNETNFYQDWLLNHNLIQPPSE